MASGGRRFRIGLVMNPLAGIGGPAALKGSDGIETVIRAKQAGSESKVLERTRVALSQLAGVKDQIEFLTVDGDMGASVLERSDYSYQILGDAMNPVTDADDTRNSVKQLQQGEVDIILFSGGDGTARDVCDVINSGQLALGIPCGVKMHSGVFANTPCAAGQLLNDIARGIITSVIDAEVRDIDEQAFRQGKVKTRYYGEMTVPKEQRYLQQTKAGNQDVDELLVMEIAAGIIDAMEPDTAYLIGSGSTTAAIMETMQLENTLLGVDVVRNGELVLVDANAVELLSWVSSNPSKLVITVIGGQGHIFGRGNQQLSPDVIRRIGVENITVIATRSKLDALNGKPLLVDTGDQALDAVLGGVMRVVTGYEDSVLCSVH